MLRVYHCSPRWRYGHLEQKPRSADGSPPTDTKALITERKKLQMAVWTPLGAVPGLQSSFSVLSSIKPAFEKNHILAKVLLLVKWEGCGAGGFLKTGWRNYVHSIVSFSNILICSVLKCYFVLPSPRSLQKAHTMHSTTKIAFWLLSPTACTLQIPRPGVCPIALCLSR